MNKRESKKDLILCRGLEVMKERGYNGTSVKDIVDAAAVPKGSFYNYFESKEDFAIEALQKDAEQSQQKGMALLANGSQPPVKRLIDFYTINANNACNGEYRVGCFLGNMCQEMSDSNEAIRLKVRQVLKYRTTMIANVLQEAIDLGEISADVSTQELAEFIFNAWEGTLMRMKGAKCREPLDAFLAILPKLLK